MSLHRLSPRDAHFRILYLPAFFKADFQAARRARLQAYFTACVNRKMPNTKIPALLIDLSFPQEEDFPFFGIS